MRSHSFTLLSVTLFAAGIVSAQAADAPYYNPENAASPSKFTTGYELFRTIGCPGKQLLDPACKAPAAAPAPAPAPMKAAPLDSDHDGVTDDKDKCPTTPAGRNVDAKGCELDGDRDGVVDALDRCPDTPAGRKVDAKGCESDGDRDGVVDALDRCPTTPAGRKVDASGCEFDGDHDGVVDALDQCPTTPSGDKVDSKGCTLLNTIILKGVNFDNDSAKLRSDSFPILDDAVATMKRYPGMKVEVAGHTDSKSSDAYNLKLSDHRAKAVMDYFVSKGVPAEDLSSKGYGESTPIADNKTAEGRAENRRVELHIQ
ncbi:MAG: OmpA family protein [Gallionellaceae bacterium]|nr:OmpA family protein [Gallionellaceae bacterium]